MSTGMAAGGRRCTPGACVSAQLLQRKNLNPVGGWGGKGTKGHFLQLPGAEVMGLKST